MKLTNEEYKADYIVDKENESLYVIAFGFGKFVPRRIYNEDLIDFPNDVGPIIRMESLEEYIATKNL